jgi:hypothetical protein
VGGEWLMSVVWLILRDECWLTFRDNCLRMINVWLSMSDEWLMSTVHVFEKGRLMIL